MNILKIVTVLLLLVKTPVFCQNEQSQLPLEALEANFRNAKSLEYVVDVSVEDHLKSGEFLAPALTPEKKLRIEYAGADENYHYKITTQWWSDKPLAVHEVAFNGNHYQWLRRGGQQIAIGSTKPGLDWEFAEYNILSIPLQFLFITDSGEIADVHLSEIKKASEAVVANSKVEKGGNISHASEFSVFPGGAFDGVHKKLRYEVFFGHNGSPLPTRWRLLTEEGRVCREFIIDEVAEANGVYYAKNARLVEYGIHMKEPSDSPRATLHFNVSMFRTDSVEKGSEVFTIDPAKAEMIWDSDNRVGISVPK